MRTRAVPAFVFLVLCACNGGTPESQGTDLAADGAGMEVVDSGAPGEDRGETDLVPDGPPPADAGADAPPACTPGTGCFLDPCTGNGDCLSGWCVTHLGSGVCTQACQEDCPPGWTCRQVAGTGPDVAFLCMSDFATLCVPCAGPGDCGDLAGPQTACVLYGEAEGSFCGGTCAEDGDCPEGFRCEELPTVQGAVLSQCVPEGGECPCSGRSVSLGLGTPCAVSNAEGVCPGTRVCLADGLSPCSAAEPAAESCDGTDNDCDGETDEGTCDDGNPCTDDACGGATGCEHLALDGGECTDGNPCTAADHCASGVCVGAAVTCNDQNPCTDDTCTETGGCLFEPNAGSCDDGDPCTVADACGGGSCTGVAVDCDCLDDGDCLALEDGDLCNGTLICAASSLPHRCVVDPATVASCPAAVGVNGPCLAATCDPETGACGFEAAGEGAPCDDGNPCQLADTCAAGACAAGLPANCNDGNPCTDDACSPLSGCTHGFNAKPCEDGNPCTLGDHCQGGACTPGPGPSCDDQNPCTDDACSPVTGCSHVPNAAPCSDGNACTTSDTCSGGACHGGASLDCNDQDPCTTDSCLLLTGCKHVINTAPCNDGNPCTTEDTCSLGVCGGTPVSCDDGNPCTDDACTAAGCKHQPNSSACSDGNTCTSGDHCAGGVCAFSQVVVCDDGNPCTTDFCSPVEGCLVLNNALPCNDGDACTTIDSCAGGACSGAALLECDDGNPCTDDTCDPGAGCVLTPNVDGCDDGNACTTVDVCGAGTCHGWVAPDCNDSNLCTTDTCDPALGCLHVHNTVPCNDGNACTTVDLCQGGSCTGSVPPSCGDGNPCTVDTCVPATGCAHAAILPCCGNLAVEPPEECDDGNQAGGDGCSGTCQDETPACRNGASLLSTAPGGTMAVCFNGSTCEQDYETLCPEGWRLCSQRQYAARNDGWGYSTGGKMGLGAIRCRGGGGAGHYTVHTGNLGQDEADNCHYGSSRPSCPAGYGCNEQGNLALCCKMNASCGNGAVDHPEEECDDGNQSDSDSCLPNCMTRFGGGC